MKFYILSAYIFSAVAGMIEAAEDQPGVGAAAYGCPFLFVQDGASPNYHSQNSGFAEVTCGKSEKYCEVPGKGNQGFQSKCVY
jgi:hypothetical protein